MNISAESPRLDSGLTNLTNSKCFDNSLVNSLVESPNHILHKK